MRTLGFALALLATSCEGPLEDSGAELATRRMVRATRISASNAGSLLLQGPRADGQVGDYALVNESFVAIIDAPGHDSDLGIPLQRHRAPTGGSLLDLGLYGVQDGLVQILQVLDYDPDLRVYYQVVEVTEQGRAIKATGRVLDPDRKLGVALDEHDLVEGLVVSTTWRMWDQENWVETETVLSNQAGRSIDIGAICDMVVTDGRGLQPFVPSPGWGFELSNRLPVTVPWVAFAGSEGAPGSYAILAPEEHTVQVVSYADRDGRVRTVLVGTDAQVKDEIRPGEQRSWTRRTTGRAGAGLSSVTQSVLDQLGEVWGSYFLELGLRGTAHAELLLDPAVAGQLVVHRTDPDRFVNVTGSVQQGGVLPISALELGPDSASESLWLPPGSYDLQLQAPGYLPGPYSFVLSSSGGESAVSLEGEGTVPVQVQVLGSDGLELDEAARLTVSGLGGTPDPDLERYSLVSGAAVSAVGGNRAWFTDGSIELSLPAGSYRLLASRGHRHPLAVAEISVPTTQQATLAFQSEAMSAGEYSSLEPVVASDASIIGGDSIEDIALALCAEDLDAWVRAEAGQVADAEARCSGQQAIRGLLGTLDVPRAGAAEGDGWMVAFPLDEGHAGPGLLPGAWLDRAWQNGALVTGILAPRARGAGGAAAGMFRARDFDRDAIDDGSANRFLRETSALGTHALDGAGLEVLSARDPWNTQDVVQDYFALLNEGYTVFPLGSSQPSWLRVDQPGAARTMVHSGQGDSDDLAAAAAAGLVYATSGPLLHLTVLGPEGSAMPGQTIELRGADSVQVQLQVSAPSWIPVERVRILLDGREAWAAEPEVTDGVRLSETIDLELVEGSWLVVDVGYSDQAPTGDYARIYPDSPVYAITAPIWLR